MSKFVYLGGPILDCTNGEANDWRKAVADKLKDHNIVGISPLRCEPLHGETYAIGYEDPRFGTARAIASKNLFDVKKCDIGIYFIPKPPEGRHHSWGTMGELHWAKALGKQTILVSDDPNVLNHPVIAASANWLVTTLDEAVDICIGILAGYCGGKNV
jgi:nucleoside 2-deoxyribosyltransferase